MESRFLEVGLGHQESVPSAERSLDCVLEGERTQLWLVLGGGGLWGICHFGVMDELQREGVPVDAIGGMSMGAVAGSFGAAHVEDRHFTRSGVEYGLHCTEQLRVLDQITENVQGRTVLALRHLFNPGGDNPDYARMMERGIRIPFVAQVARLGSVRNRYGQFLDAQPGDSMERVLTIARASAALKPKFGMDPVEIDGVSYKDDPTVASVSTHTMVAEARRRGAAGVIGVPISFFDTSGLGKAAQKFVNFLYPPLRDRGDVTITSKDGRGPFNGEASLTNLGRGCALRPERFARTQENLSSPGTIAIPTEEFVEAGRVGVRRSMPRIERLLKQLKIW